MKFFSSCVDVWLECWNWRIYPACWCFAGRRWYSQAEVIHAPAVLPDVRWDACLWKRDKVGELITIIIIIITMTMFMVLSSWPKSVREFTRFIWWMLTEHRVAANPQTKPVDLGCEFTKNRLLQSTSTVTIVIITQSVSWYLFYRPTEGGRLSRSVLSCMLVIGRLFIPPAVSTDYYLLSLSFVRYIFVRICRVII